MPKQNGGREAGASASNFIRSIVASDVEAGRTRIVVARFPPEPNGYLHLGHAKSIVLNYELAKEFGGRGNLRLDDTNPAKEKVEYIDAIERDVQWLGFGWAQGLHFASDYFEQLYAWARAGTARSATVQLPLHPTEPATAVGSSIPEVANRQGAGN